MVEEVKKEKEKEVGEPEKMERPQKRRPFATGSKPGPDEIDHHLESKGFYRKHVARDASSLFRVVAEIVFDIQNFHDKVRFDCASFIEKNQKDYLNVVEKNVFAYATQLRRLRTHGTLFDLSVLARMYKKNVILYEPTKCSETIERYFVKNDDYDDKNPMRIFYSDVDKHFDIIFTLEYTEQLAECQGLIYEVLYIDVFKLPDVNYAVERMLHDPEGTTTLELKDDPSKYTNAAGEVIAFEKPEDTNCVLKDPRTCHYHNQEDFDEVIEEHKDLVTVINRSDEPHRLKIYKPIDGFLHEKDKSCVRQLLNEKITPFPYKVAKALDKSIYRNTDFELWSDNRKEQRLKWLDSNGFPVREQEELFSTGEKKHVSHKITIQELDEILKSPDLMKKPPFYSFDVLDNYGPIAKNINAGPIQVYPAQFTNKKFGHYQANRRRGNFHHNYGHRFDNYHQSPHPFGPENYYADPEHHQLTPAAPPQLPQPQPGFVENAGYPQYIPYEQLSPPGTFPAQTAGGTHYYIPTAYPVQYTTIPPQPNYVPNVNFSIPPPAIPVQNAPPQVYNPLMNLIRENELTTNINQTPAESVDPRGNDLPLTDTPSLQFYYNLGVRYFLQIGTSVRSRLEGVVNQLENINVNPPNQADQNPNTNTNDASGKNESQQPPPVPANTPVSSKIHQTASGNKFVTSNPPTNNRYLGGNGNRRQYNNQNRENNYRDNQNTNWRANQNRPESHNQGTNNNPIVRKESGSGIQFNSNAKNIHKIESDMKSLPKSVHQSQNQQQDSSNLNVEVPQQPLTIQTNAQNVAAISPNQSVSTLPISPIGHIDINIANEHAQGHWQQQQQQQHPQQPPPMAQPQSQVPVQVYQYPGTPSYMPQPAPVYYYNENGDLVSYQTPQQVVQPLYYNYPQAPPHQPIYYQPQPPVPSNQYYDDSGHVDSSSVQNYTYSVYYPPPPMYYPPTPASATVIQATPVFPVVHTPQIVVGQNVTADPSNPTTVENTSTESALDENAANQDAKKDSSNNSASTAAVQKDEKNESAAVVKKASN